MLFWQPLFLFFIITFNYQLILLSNGNIFFWLGYDSKA